MGGSRKGLQRATLEEYVQASVWVGKHRDTVTKCVSCEEVSRIMHEECGVRLPRSSMARLLRSMGVKLSPDPRKRHTAIATVWSYIWRTQDDIILLGEAWLHLAKQLNVKDEIYDNVLTVVSRRLQEKRENTSTIRDLSQEGSAAGGGDE